MECLECGNDPQEESCKREDCPYPKSGEFISGRLEGIYLHRCEPLDCQCGHCEVD